MNLYRYLLRPLLFRIDAEPMHNLAIRAARIASGFPRLCDALAARNTPHDERLEIDIGGLHFATPLGLAAGFDKNARATRLLSALGFGHIEVGSVSALPSPGNPKPRLFRIPADRGLVVNYGLPNEGANRIAERLRRVRLRAPLQAPLGINIVSTNRRLVNAELPDHMIIGDYVQSVRWLQDRAEYLCLNLSCPNTREGRDFFRDPARLRRLLEALEFVEKPLFLKVAPFATVEEIDAFLAAVEPATSVIGFSVNLPSGKPTGLETARRKLDHMPGAVSGRPAEAEANRTIRDLYRRMDRRRYRIIGSGGVFTAEDAYRKIRLGASLVQILTALVYEGPGVVRRINQGLAQLLARDGFARVADAVGVDAREPGMEPAFGDTRPPGAVPIHAGVRVS
jgi:dihydroorotate dehydrogenase (fumarate)/dihydroorotate dehydrogenase